jgi:prefoldin subunit 5
MESLLKKRQDFMEKALVDMEDSAEELAQLLSELLDKIEEIYQPDK